MTREDLKREIMEILEDMDVCEQASLFNEYCESAGYPDDEVAAVEFIDDYFSAYTPSQVWETLRNLSPQVEYFYYNGYGNIEEWEGIESNSSIEEVAEFIIDNNDCLYNDDILSLLDEYTEEQNDEE